MGLDLGGGRRLVLAVGEEGWIWVVAGAAAAGLLLALSRYERRLVPRSVGRLLLALRLAAAAALVVAMLEPVARRSWTDRVVGRVVVGIDLSGSMETVDDRRPEEDRDRLRTAEGLAPEGDGQGGDPARRAGISARILRGPALAELAREHQLEAIGFARSASSGSVSDLAGALDRGEAPGDGLATDWGPVLDRAIGPEGGPPVLGVVLLTDGRRNAPGGGEDSRADELARRGVPVFPVLVGSTVPPRDAAVSAIRAPGSAFAGDTAAVLVEVKADGFDPGAEIPVTLEVPGSDALREVVRAGPDGVRAVAAFRVPMERAGTVELAARVEPPGGSDGRPENDRRAAIVRVGDEPARVLLVDGEARWEFRYLRNALERDRRVELDAVLLAPPPPSEGSEPTYASTLPGDSGEGPGPDGPDPINAYDVIILGDVPPGLVPPDLWDRLDAFVSERGGTLVIAAGPRGWPGGWSGVESASAMLPVVDPRAVAVDRSAVDPSRAAIPPGVSVVPEDSAGASPGDWPMLQFAADPAQSRSAWEGLAPLGWALSGRAKPGASALLVVDEGSGDGGGAEGVVVAAQPFGLGKVLWVGTDGTWRWRLRVGDAYHHRFWGQVVRWAAEGPTVGGNRLVRFGPDRPELPEGVPVSLRAEFSEEVPGVSPELIAAARIFEEGGDGTPDGGGRDPVALVPLRASADRPRTFEASAPALPSGRYVAVLDVPELAVALEEEGLSAPEASFEVSPEETDELIELAADREALDRLASITGGRVVRDFEAGLLPGLIAPQVVEETRTAEAPLWDTPAGLLAFFGLMAAEWIVRKRAGLP